jgi:hydrogenase-1 operon protein HyaF
VSINDIPVTVVGPGSQPDGDKQLSYIDMPGDMDTYSAPLIQDLDAVQHLSAARETMEWLRRALASYRCGAAPLIANLSALDEASRDLVNQILGEGEVSITYSGTVAARTQESVLAGVWRTMYFDANDCAVCDLLEVADAPHVVRRADEGCRPIDVSKPDEARDVPNALPILTELEYQAGKFRHDGVPHSVNLSLLPLSDTELEFLDRRLGRGTVDILSRSYGKCQIISTRSRDVWWVRYYNSMGILILNSLEVADVPVVVNAAAEDLRDSAQRLDDILAPYWSDVA